MKEAMDRVNDELEKRQNEVEDIIQKVIDGAPSYSNMLNTAFGVRDGMLYSVEFAKCTPEASCLYIIFYENSDAVENNDILFDIILQKNNNKKFQAEVMGDDVKYNGLKREVNERLNSLIYKGTLDKMTTDIILKIEDMLYGPLPAGGRRKGRKSRKSRKSHRSNKKSSTRRR